MSYKLGDLFYATACNRDPGAAIARPQAETRDAAEGEVRATAMRRLERTRSFDGPAEG